MRILIFLFVLIKFSQSHKIWSFCDFQLGANDDHTCRLWNAFVIEPNQTINHKISDFLRWTPDDITHMYAEESQLNFITPVIFENYHNLVDVKFEDVFLEKIENDTFKNCDKLILLSLERNNLSEIPENALKSCDKIEKINLSKNRINLINPEAFHGLENLMELNLEENKINRDQVGFAEIPRLKILNLKSNNLVNPRNNLIHNLNLRELSIAFNEMADIPDDFFKNSKKLTKLFLNDNQLDFLLKIPFYSLENLEILDLKNNKISSIQSNLFSNLTKLTKLHLENNLIQEIVDNAFDNLGNLITLTLSHNEFKARNRNPRMSLRSLVNLEILDLSHNEIDQLDENFDITSCTKLKEINFSHNLINLFHENVLRSMENLEKISLAFNNLTLIFNSTFSQNIKLKDIDLSNNRIRRVETVLFQNLSALEKLNLSNNAIMQISPDFQTLLENSLITINVDLTNNNCINSGGIEECFENYINNITGEDSTTTTTSTTTENPGNGVCSKFCYNFYILGVTVITCMAFY